MFCLQVLEFLRSRSFLVPDAENLPRKKGQEGEFDEIADGAVALGEEETDEQPGAATGTGTPGGMGTGHRTGTGLETGTSE